MSVSSLSILLPEVKLLQSCRSVRDDSTQTSEILTYDKEIQSVISTEIETQTDPEEDKRPLELVEDKSEVFYVVVVWS